VRSHTIKSLKAMQTR